MIRRQESNYTALWDRVDELMLLHCGSLPLTQRKTDSALFVSDCEYALINSIQNRLDFSSNSRFILRCFFHFNQNIKMKYKSNLSTEITHGNPNFVQKIRNIFVIQLKLAFSPTEISLAINTYIQNEMLTDTFCREKKEIMK